MIYYNNDNLLIRSMIESDIEKLVAGFAEQHWNKPFELFHTYFMEQVQKEKLVLVATLCDALAGYVTLLPCAKDGPFANMDIPEIMDFNVLIKYQKRGIGTKMMDIIEDLAKQTSNSVSLSVGLHAGYGIAQTMYAKRGYIPDGTGVWYNGKQLGQNETCMNDDNLTLYLLKTFQS